MDTALRASIRKSLTVTLLIAALGVGYVVHGAVGSSAGHKAVAHAPVKLTAADLLRAASSATAGIYLQFDGVSGPPDPKFKGLVPLTSFQFGVARSTSGVGGSRVVSKPAVSDITVTHTSDGYSAGMLQQSLTGDGTGNARIYFTKLSAGGKLVNYLEFDLTNALVTGYSTSSGGDQPSESFSLNFAAFTMIAHMDGFPEQTVSYTIV